tara:strand:- start:2919 stop:3773 length:855 start_codon:yes stop_codon:yes gene_type:complete
MIERIYIPTVRRTDKQITYENLPDELKRKVVMVIEPDERHLYNYDCEYLEIPEKLVGTWTQLAETRLFIHKHAGKIKYCVSDDDVIINRRNSKYWSNTSNMEKSRRYATDEDILEMFSKIDAWLDESDIGIVGLTNTGTPPSYEEYLDTVGVFCMIFIDGTMLSKIIDDIDITSIRVAEDVLFSFECLSRGINTRRSNEWLYTNRSIYQKDLQDSREVWANMYKNKEIPPDFYQSTAHIDAMRVIQSKFPQYLDIFEKNGKVNFRKKWKKVYRSNSNKYQKQLF